MPKPKPEAEKKVTVSARVTPAALDALDKVAERLGDEIGFKPTVSQLIERAITEYLRAMSKKK